MNDQDLRKIKICLVGDIGVGKTGLLVKAIVRASPGARTSAFVGGFVGVLIGLLASDPFWLILGVILGTTIGGIIGWIQVDARNIRSLEIENKAPSHTRKQDNGGRSH